MLGKGIGKLWIGWLLKNAENAAGPLADFAIDIPTFEEAVFFFFLKMEISKKRFERPGRRRRSCTLHAAHAVFAWHGGIEGFL